MLVESIVYFDRSVECADRQQLRQIQQTKLRNVLDQVAASNPFYQKKWAAAGIDPARDVRTLDDLSALPFTTKHELVADQAAHPPFGTNLTFPLEQYIRLHQTSGTTGKPLRWLDTEESWDWWARCWGAVYRAAGVGPGDRIFFAFSFGPFIGFWSAFEGARKIGAMAISGGAQTSQQRLYTLLENEATVLLCTPTYALRLAEVARECEGVDIVNSSIRRTIHAGEPGASIPATRARIEAAWGAQCFDHTGATEVGATGFTCVLQPGGVHLNEGEFIFEILDPATGQPADEGELVVTNLGRIGSPVIRYRTGDRVKVRRDPCACGRTFMQMEGGILGRVDDMITVRGVNLFPSAIENIVRSFKEVEEFRIEVFRQRHMDEVKVSLELAPHIPAGPSTAAVVQMVSAELRKQLAIRCEVTTVPCGSLPRFELKAKRCVVLTADT